MTLTDRPTHDLIKSRNPGTKEGRQTMTDHRQITRDTADRERGKVRCDGCGRKPLEYPYYEGMRSGASLCGACAATTTTEHVRKIG